ncbi:MAG: hypothetical protein M1812_001723 [Candelaria pacifica]|nr:MAG: hypothetical protein M1812_001723 [Candelaria pacifica]
MTLTGVAGSRKSRRLITRSLFTTLALSPSISGAEEIKHHTINPVSSMLDKPSLPPFEFFGSITPTSEQCERSASIVATRHTDASQESSHQDPVCISYSPSSNANGPSFVRTGLLELGVNRCKNPAALLRTTQGTTYTKHFAELPLLGWVVIPKSFPPAVSTSSSGSNEAVQDSSTPCKVDSSAQHVDATRFVNSPAGTSSSKRGLSFEEALASLSAMSEHGTIFTVSGTEMDTPELSTKLINGAIPDEAYTLLHAKSKTPGETPAAYTGQFWIREKSKDTSLTDEPLKCFEQFNERCVGFSGSESVKSLAKRIFTDWSGIPTYALESPDMTTSTSAMSSGSPHKARDIVGHFNISTEQIWFQYGPGVSGTIPASIGSTLCPVPSTTVVSATEVALTPTTMTVVLCPVPISQNVDKRAPDPTPSIARRTSEATSSSPRMEITSSAESSLQFAGPAGVSYLPASQGSAVCPTPFDIITVETVIKSTSTTVTISLCPVYETFTRRDSEPASTIIERRKISQAQAKKTREHKTFDKMPGPLREFFGCIGDGKKQPWECSKTIHRFETWIKTKDGHGSYRGYGVIIGKLEDKPQPWKELLCRLDKYETQTYAEASAPGNSSIAKESSRALLEESIRGFEYWLQTPRGFSDFNAYKKDMVHKINSGKVPIYVEHYKSHQIPSVISACTPTRSSSSATASATSMASKHFLTARDTITRPVEHILPRNLLHPSKKQIRKCKADANRPVFRKRGIPVGPNPFIANLLQRRATTDPVPAAEALLVPDPLGAHCNMIGYREHLMLLLVCLVFLILSALGFLIWYLRRLNRHHHQTQTPETESSRERARSNVTMRDPNTFNDIVIPEEDPHHLPSDTQTRPWFSSPLSKRKRGEVFKKARANDPENIPPRARIPSSWKNGTSRDEAIPLKQRQPLGETHANDRGGEPGSPRVVSTGTDRGDGEGKVVNRKGSSQGYGSV